ncbi:MAG: Nre family DNA repair protein [Candidatus Micrarchaeia archaeon]
MRPDSRICIYCKGSRLLCGKDYCPLLKKCEIVKGIKGKVKDYLFGPTPPNLFVGHFGYPKVNFGPMVSIEESEIGSLDDPSSWFGLEFEKIVKLRSNLFRAMKLKDVNKIDRDVMQIQELIFSIKPIDVEAKISKINYRIVFDSDVQPMGPSSRLENLRICENPRIPKEVDEIIEERMKAENAIRLLYEKKFDIYYLTKIFSSGALGIEKKIVPTRWSITAVDDIIGRENIKKIKKYKELEGIYVASGEYMDNHFEILLIPGKWEFENFEAWAPGTLWSFGLSEPAIIEDYEGYYGKKDYSIQGGGYYASRLGVTEFLENIKRQARVVVFREIYAGYQVPLGVWVVRENVRNAFKKIMKFYSLKDAIEFIKGKLKNPIEIYLKKSKILTQKRLSEY